MVLILCFKNTLIKYTLSLIDFKLKYVLKMIEFNPLRAHPSSFSKFLWRHLSLNFQRGCLFYLSGIDRKLFIEPSSAMAGCWILITQINI